MISRRLTRIFDAILPPGQWSWKRRVTTYGIVFFAGVLLVAWRARFEPLAMATTLAVLIVLMLLDYAFGYAVALLVGCGAWALLWWFS